MKTSVIALLCLAFAPTVLLAEPPGRFDVSRDLFLPQFDSKTDVDDLHSVAAVATILHHPKLEGVQFHAVAGAYGIQEGRYVPSPALFEEAFAGNWSDAHGDRAQALDTVIALSAETLQRGGSIWVAEAGQSDFTADWLQALADRGLDIRHVNVVQHSDWNESVTTPEKLARVKSLATYHRIDDGNASHNGTPNFNTPSGEAWEKALKHEHLGTAWTLARNLADQYNGEEDRYFNPSIAAGGLDFSDAVETCFIFGCDELDDVDAFFATF